MGTSRQRRFNTFAGIFPDALDSLSRALRAGYPLSAAFESVASEYPEPLSGELLFLEVALKHNPP